VITGATDGIGRAYAEEVKVFYSFSTISINYLIVLPFYGRLVGLSWSKYRAD
jgi:hypothetical protein